MRQRTGMRLFVIMFTLIPSIFACVGGFLAWSQDKKIQTYVPVDAKVLSTRIERKESRDSDGHTSVSYKPVVEYKYGVDGRDYQCNDVMPFSRSASNKWARSVVNQFPKGKTVTAYYDPGNPNKAFLIKRHSFFPYIFMHFPVIFWTVAFFVWRGMSASSRAHDAPEATTDGWFEIKTESKVGARLKSALCVGVAWHLYGAATCGHYFSVAEAPYELTAWIASGVYEGLGLIPLFMIVYYALLRRNVDDARVLIDREHLAPGETFTVTVGQPVRRDIRIDGLSIGLVLSETTRARRGNKTSYSTRDCYEDRDDALGESEARGGHFLSASRDISIPVDQSPSTPSGGLGYPEREWRIEVVTRIQGSPDFGAKYPVTVHRSPQVEAE